LTQLRSSADAKRGEVEKSRQTHVTATQEKARLAQVTTTRAAERDALAARLHAAANTAGFADEPAVRAARLPVDQADALGLRRKSLDERGVVLATQSTALAGQRKALPEAASGDALQLAALQTEQTSGETERATAQASIGELRARLKADDEQRARQAGFAAQIERAHQEYARWDRLRALIGSADGSVFARFAQGLTLERLTALANRHLAQLNPRYSIRRAKEGPAGDLELEIVDHYQADVTRPMRSLSGGESFLVSLALALGLPELASGRTSIESLFIDEGFGSLDADTLELAMAALENLQAGGKTIGVISHVPAMQERIPAQIKVVKESAGCSRVTIAN
jgi:exonuclease SbcC